MFVISVGEPLAHFLRPLTEAAAGSSARQPLSLSWHHKPLLNKILHHVGALDLSMESACNLTFDQADERCRQEHRTLHDISMIPSSIGRR